MCLRRSTPFRDGNRDRKVNHFDIIQRSSKCFVPPELREHYSNIRS